MIIRVTLPLKRVSEQKHLGGFTTNEEIQKSFRKKGLSLAPKLDPGQQPEQSYMLEVISTEEKIVPAYSTLHFRDLAAKNCASDPEVSFSHEIYKYTIFFGASTSTRSFWIITRVIDGEISIMIRNKSVKKALETFEKHIGDILNFKFIDDKKAIDRPIEFHTISKNGHALTAFLTKRSIPRSFRLNPVETSIAIFSFIMLAITFSIDNYFPTSLYTTEILSDPLHPALRKVVSSWHVFGISLTTSVLTVLVKHFVIAKKNYARWEK